MGREHPSARPVKCDGIERPLPSDPRRTWVSRGLIQTESTFPTCLSQIVNWAKVAGLTSRHPRRIPAPRRSPKDGLPMFSDGCPIPTAPIQSVPVLVEV